MKIASFALPLLLAAAGASVHAADAPAAASAPASGPASAATAAANPNIGKATLRCEDAVSETIQRVRGKEAHDVQFVAAKRVLASDGDDIGVKGEGRYRRGAGTMPFTYSCAFNVATGGTSGVVFKDSAADTAADARPWQPDLTNVSPEACETAVASVLKDKYPRVSGISFRSDTRRLQPAAGGTRIGLDGQGQLQRAAGMNAQGFNYRCEIDPRSGRVMSAKASDQ